MIKADLEHRRLQFDAYSWGQEVYRHMAYFKLFERQLHVATVIIVIHVVTPVMHGKELHEPEF